MKFVAISDTHLHPWKPFATGVGINNSRMLGTLRIMRESLAKARELDCPWIHAGDMIHTAGYVKNSVLVLLTDLLLEYQDVDLYLVGGNHDSRGKGGHIAADEYIQYALARSRDNVYHLGDNCPNIVETRQGYTLGGASFQANPEDIENLFTEGASIGVFHDHVIGARFPSGTVATRGFRPDWLREYFDLSIVGDIHHPTYDNGILIPGSPEHHNFGDKGSRGFWYCADEDKDAPLESVESSSPKFLTVETPEEIVDDVNFYRVTSSVSGPLPSNAIGSLAVTGNTLRSVEVSADSPLQALEYWLSHNEHEGDSAAYLEFGRLLLPTETEQVVPRDVTVQSLCIQDFGSYGTTQIDLSPGTYIVTGQSAAYESNGAGKSTLFESLYWALTGKTTKGGGVNEIIRRGRNEAKVSVSLRVESEAIEVHRTRTKNETVLEVTVDGEPVEAPSTTELTKWLLDRLGITPKLWKALGYFSQEDVVLVSQARDAEAKTLLSDLCGLGPYQEAFETAGQVLSDSESTLEKVIASPEGLQSQIDEQEDLLQTLLGEQSEWNRTKHQSKADALSRKDSASVQLDSLVKEEESLRLEADKQHEDLKRKLDSVKDAHIQDALESILQDDDNTYLLLAEAQEKALASLKENRLDPESSQQWYDALDQCAEMLTKCQTVLQSWQNGKRDAEVSLRGLEGTITTLHERRDLLQSGVCPECHQPSKDATTKLAALVVELESAELAQSNTQLKLAECIKGIEDTSSYLAELETSLVGLQDTCALFSKYQTATEAQELETGHVKQRTKMAKANATDLVTRQHDAQLTEITTSYADKILACVNAQKVEQMKIDNADRDLNRITKESSPYADQIQRLQCKIQELRETKEKVKLDVEKALTEVAMARYWRKAFSKSGIQSLLLDNLAALFAEERKHVFPTLTRGLYDVTMQTTTQNRSGDVKDKLNFQVWNRGVVVPYTTLSGGQKRRVDIGVLLTLILAVSKSLNIRGIMGMLILDEVFSYLDSDGAESLADTLRDFPIPQVYVVSQKLELQALFSNNIHVVQGEDYVSYLEVENQNGS